MKETVSNCDIMIITSESQNYYNILDSNIKLPASSPPAIERWPQGRVLCTLAGSRREKQKRRAEEEEKKTEPENRSSLCRKCLPQQAVDCIPN